VGTEDDPQLSLEDQEKQLFQLLDAMDPDARLACEKLIVWMAERSKSSEPRSEDELRQMFEETRLENIRRRLGGKVGEILPFRKPDLKE
jgi:hypothetical protein